MLRGLMLAHAGAGESGGAGGGDGGARGSKAAGERGGRGVGQAGHGCIVQGSKGHSADPDKGGLSSKGSPDTLGAYCTSGHLGREVSRRLSPGGSWGAAQQPRPAQHVQRNLQAGSTFQRDERLPLVAPAWVA